MAQTGYTPISIYYSSTAGNTPTAGNLVAGELAINTADGKLFYKDSAGVVQVIAGKGGAGVAGGSNTQVQYNSSGSLAGSANFTFNGTTVTIANDASISGLTVGKGGGAVASATAVGAGAMAATNTGAANSAFGGSALAANTSGYYNSAFGYLSSAGTTTGNGNSSFGRASLYTNTTGASNTAVGQDSLFSNTTASNNTAVGYQAGYSNATGTFNTFVGYQAAYTSLGDYQTAIGVKALYLNTTGQMNSALGVDSLGNNTTGSNNTALGFQTLKANTTASNNTAVGYQAGYSGTTSSGNTTIGYQAGYTANNTGGNAYNTLVGYKAGFSLTTGYGNTFIGAYPAGTGAGQQVTTGYNNTILGGYNGNQGGLDIRTASNYIVLSDGDGNPRGVFNGSGYFSVGDRSYGGYSNAALSVAGGTSQCAIFSHSLGSGNDVISCWNPFTSGNNNFIQFYTEASPTSRGQIYYNRVGGLTVYATTSDQRLKENIVDAPSALEKIDSVKIRSFNWKETGNKVDFGVIAQELIEVAPEAVIEGVDNAEFGQNPYWQVDTATLVPAMIKAIQELKAEVDSLKQQLGK